MRGFRWLPVCLLVLIGLHQSYAWAASRGLRVAIRASDRTGAPVAETVQLYTASRALVIGNDNYDNGWPRLSNAVNDAKAIATELRIKGFSVELHTNVDSAALNKILRRFFIVQGADPTARLFIWFAGHGVTVDGEGYLVPIDAPLPSKRAQFKLKAIALRDFDIYMRQAESKHVYAVFDACFAGSIFSTSRGVPPPAITLATTQPVREFLTSGDANQPVSDNGMFRKLFIRALNGEEDADANGDGYVTASELGMFMDDRITNLTQARQTPRYGKLNDKGFDRGDFVFKLPAAATPVQKPGNATSQTEIAFWQSIKDSDNVSAFNAYLKRFPHGVFAQLAMIRKSELENRPGGATETPAPPTVKHAAEVATRKVTQRAVAHVPFTVTFLDQNMHAVGDANVRETPFPDAERVGQLKRGATVWAIGQTQTHGTTWYKVARDGVALGFVYGPLLASIGATDETVAVKPLPPPAVSAMPAPATTSGTTSMPKPSVSATTKSATPAATTIQQAKATVEAAPTASSPASKAAPSAATNKVEPASAPGGDGSAQNNLAPGEILVQVVSSPSQLTPVVTKPPPVTAATRPPVQATNAPSPGSSATPGGATARPSAPTAATPQTADTSLALATTTVKTTLSPFVRRYVDAAKAGNTKAQLALGYMYETGQKVAMDKKEAVKWYEMAAKGGEVRAMISLGLLFQSSRVVGVDLAKAAKWFLQAAQAGNADAAQTVGYMYENGQGVPKNIADAVHWYEQAAKQGKVAAENNLGRLYQLGVGVPKDLARARLWYQKAAEQGNAAAQRNLEKLEAASAPPAAQQ